MRLYPLILKLRQYSRLVFAGIFIALFTLALAVLAAIGAAMAQNEVDRYLAAELAEVDRFGAGIHKTVEALAKRTIDEPCMEPFLRWMRRIAFVPHGIHDIIYTRNDLLLCSVTAGTLGAPIFIGEPDFAILPGGVSKVWVDRDLAKLDIPGAVGTFLSVGDFILVLPNLALDQPLPSGMLHEIVSLTSEGTIWHRKGEPGLYNSVTEATGHKRWDLKNAAAFSAHGCDLTNTTCFAVATPIAPLVQKHLPAISGAIALAAFFAGVISRLLQRVLKQSWSFPSRFRRMLSIKTIVCLYQPLLDLHENRFCGLEVLARWRDDTGKLVSPHHFLSVVERYHLHRVFTQYVIDRAYGDLSDLAVGEKPLRIHFNIFPCDFDPDWMLVLFKDFLADRSRFTVVIELVESDALPIDRTRAAIARLREEGILTFIDDFGEGYSSIGYLASLGTYGVKLDRSFGFAPEGSLMDAMLTSAVEMISKTGQTIVVEGVETSTRLAKLKANPKVSVAQGYHVSRPLSIEALKIALHRDQNRPTIVAA